MPQQALFARKRGDRKWTRISQTTYPNRQGAICAFQNALIAGTFHPKVELSIRPATGMDTAKSAVLVALLKEGANSHSPI